MSRRFATALALVLATAACEGPDHFSGGGFQYARPPKVRPGMLETDAPEYGPGSKIALRLTNRTGRSVLYNLCSASLERRDGDGDWRQAQPGLAEVCTRELRVLYPGQTATYAFSPEVRRRGEYRIRAMLDDTHGGLRTEVFSNTFRIVGSGD